MAKKLPPTANDFLVGVFDKDDLDAIATDAAFPLVPHDLETDYRCPACSFEWSGTPKPAQEVDVAVPPTTVTAAVARPSAPPRSTPPPRAVPPPPPRSAAPPPPARPLPLDRLAPAFSDRISPRTVDLDSGNGSVAAFEPLLDVFAAPPPAPPAPPRLDPSVVVFSGVATPVTDWRPTTPPPLDGIDTLELDTETNGLHAYAGDRPIGISCRRPNGIAFYLPWGHVGGNLDEETVRRWAQRELRGKHLTGANIRFDVHMLHAWGVDLEAQGCTVSDVQHYAALLDDNRKESFSLDALAKSYLKKEKSGRDLDKTRMASYHASIVEPYAEHDVQLTGELRDVLWPLLDKEDLQRVRQLEDDVIYPVCEMERNAAPVDRAMLQTWVRESEAEYNDHLTRITRETGFLMNPDAQTDWVRLFAFLNIQNPHKTELGAVSFTDDYLKTVQHPLVQLARRAGKLASLRSKFLVAYNDVVGDDALLRFSLHQLRGDQYGTVRGRFSMSDKNLQQVFTVEKQREAFGYDEKDSSHDDEIYLIRKLFVPGSGLFLLSDAEQIEYRIAAHFAASPSILAAYAADPHTDYHNLVMELVRPRKTDITRKLAKGLNFALVFGAGKDKVAAILNLPRTESDKFVAAYDQMFPESKTLLRTASSLASTRGYIRTLLGRRARFPNSQFAYKALNACIQGTAADIMKQKIVEVHKARKQTGFVLRKTIHDSITGDAPDQACAEKVHAILNTQTAGLKVPITWSTKTGKNWSEC